MFLLLFNHFYLFAQIYMASIEIYLIYLLYNIPTFVSYLMPKPSIKGTIEVLFNL